MRIRHIFFFFFFWSEIRKVLSKISKEKGCKVLDEWIKPCEKHLHWSATSTLSDNGRVIWAKFKSFLSHVVNKHAGLEDALFNKCAHGIIEPRKWLKTGMFCTQFLSYSIHDSVLKNCLISAFCKACRFCLTLAYQAHNWRYFFPHRYCCIWQTICSLDK